ncbi:MAG TPA: response regulator transcription factor [Dehalococcoidia bacterium]|nr:response regulator transcription factor [Dehalococcoidia bacterium]
MAQTTVMVVDDEPAITELLRDFFEADGFRVLSAQNGQDALDLLDRDAVDCLLLDVMMPGRSGFDVCRQIRERSDVPVLFLSARDQDVDKIRGLGLGDDYIVKSATPGEVVARVKTVLRRARRGLRPAAGATLDFGPLQIDLRAHEVRVGGQPVPFTAREFAVLCLLAEHPRQVFTRDQIFEHCWGEEYGDRHTVTVHIGRIREKIEPDPNRPRYIVTVWGVGYRFERPPAAPGGGERER